MGRRGRVVIFVVGICFAWQDRLRDVHHGGSNLGGDRQANQGTPGFGLQHEAGVDWHCFATIAGYGKAGVDTCGISNHRDVRRCDERSGRSGGVDPRTERRREAGEDCPRFATDAEYGMAGTAYRFLAWH